MEKKRILVVGGVAGGASAAARARRLCETCEIIIFERGGQVSFANCGMPYHISGDIEQRERLLLLTPKMLRQRFRIDTRVHTEVVKIDREHKRIIVFDKKKKIHYTEHYTDLILSPGARAVRLPVPGAKSKRIHVLRDLHDMDLIIKALRNDDDSALVIGAGFIGLEITEALVKRGKKVTLVERGAHVMPGIDSEMATLVHQELRLNGVRLLLNCAVERFDEDATGVLCTLSDATRLHSALTVMAVGVTPESDLAVNAGIEVGKRGGIVVDAGMRTNDASIYAVGDVAQTQHAVTGEYGITPLAGLASRQGRIAADTIFAGNMRFKKTLGTAICKVFDIAVGVTGASERALERCAIPYEKIYLHPMNHAGYYPGSAPISIKLLFNPSTGLLLGAQALGKDGIDKRIDIFSLAIRHRLSVFDLEELELCYAPPYGSAKDPVNYAGMVAANVIRGDVTLCHSENIRSEHTLLDVRLEDELLAGSITGAIHIPLEQLSERLDELPRKAKIVVFCREGVRAYQACMMLKQLGYDAANLSGGYKSYRMYKNQEEHRDTNVHQNSATINPTQDTAIVCAVDATGLSCPGPILKLKRAIHAIKIGQALSITSTDPAFVVDVPAWCRRTGHQLLEIAPINGNYRAVVVRGEQR